MVHAFTLKSNWKPTSERYGEKDEAEEEEEEEDEEEAEAEAEGAKKKTQVKPFGHLKKSVNPLTGAAARDERFRCGTGNSLRSSADNVRTIPWLVLVGE